VVAFLFDECIPPQIARALSIVEYDAVAVGDVPELGRGADDAEVIRWCGERGAVLVTADLKMKRPSGYRELMKESGISVAFFKPRKGGWLLKEWFRQVVRQTDHMEDRFSRRGPSYWRYSSKGRGKPVAL
jgi:hypothetical protein